MAGMQDLTVLLERISQNILDEINKGEISAEDVEKQVKELRDIYNHCLNLKEGDENYRRPEFNNSVTRLAYTFSYYVRHVHVLRNSLSTSIDATNDAEKEEHILDSLRSITLLCAIGGGPNTDSVGLRLFLRDRQLGFPEKVRVLDKFVDWEMTWSTLQRRIPYEYRHDARYIQFDLLADIDDQLLDAASPTDVSDPLSVIREADLITMIKSLSDVDSDTVKATERVRQILTEMKTGALLLFIDNTYCEWRKVFREAGYKKTHNILLIDADIDVGDLKTEELESEAFQKLRAMINNYPLLRANNSKNVMMLIEKK